MAPEPDRPMSPIIRNDNLPLADVEVHYLGSEHVGDEFQDLHRSLPGSH